MRVLAALPDDAIVFEVDGYEFEGRPGGIGGDLVTGITLMSSLGECPRIGLAFIGDPVYSSAIPLDRLKPLTQAARDLLKWASGS